MQFSSINWPQTVLVDHQLYMHWLAYKDAGDRCERNDVHLLNQQHIKHVKPAPSAKAIANRDSHDLDE